jgi:hypothetical protein
MKELLLLKDKQTSDVPTSNSAQNRSSSLINTLRGTTNEEKLNNLWLKMQITINSIFDSSLDNRSGGRVAKGIRQVGQKNLSNKFHWVFSISGYRKKRRFISYAYDG